MHARAQPSGFCERWPVVSCNGYLTHQCQRTNQPEERRTHDAMGTIFTIAVGDAVSTEVVDEATREAFAEIDRIEALISEWRPSSEISLVNAAAGRGSVLVSPETYECVERGLALSRATDGAFDLTWAALRGLWKFGPESAPRLPSPEAVTAALARVAEPLHAMAFHATSAATLVGLAALALGALAFRYYGRTAGVDSLRADLPRFYGVLEFRWMDTFYGWVVASVQRRVVEFIAFLDLLLINGVAVRWLGAGIPAVIGYLAGRTLHRGQTRLYALSLVAGTLLLAWYFLAR